MEKRMVCKCEDEEIDRLKLHAFRREGEGGFMGNTPIFSQRHYIAIGELLKKFPNETEIFNKFIWMFEADNPKFERQRFIDFVEGRRKN